MNLQTSLGKAFEINKNPNIYGTFAEIGAGQETVNFFYRAGLASQTVAKSMSAYDMTFSDEIYGKQDRYVCKKRLITMLNHEYRLLEKRLKKKSGDKTRFFVFATTAVTSSKKKQSVFSNNEHAWMGLRFQDKPNGSVNDIIFHVNCLDKNRLQQHEALGILGVNLIYASFYYRDKPKKFIQSLTEHLSNSRLEIHAMTCSGPSVKKFTTSFLNLELISQKLSSLAFFTGPKKCEFLSDIVFNKSTIIIFGKPWLVKNFKKNQTALLKILKLTENNSLPIQFAPKNQKLLKQNKYETPILISEDSSIKKLKKLCSLYSFKPISFVISEEDFTEKIFNPKYYKEDSLLKNLGELFDNDTKLLVLSKNQDFSLKNHSVKGSSVLKNHLINQKQILSL